MERASDMPSQSDRPAAGSERRRRGRPSLMDPQRVLERIRRLAESEQGLFRIHRTHPGLYARARRQFGSWAAAVRAVGLDYLRARAEASERSLRNRRRRKRLERS